MTSKPKRGLVVHLFPSHFTIGDCDVLHQYNGHLSMFIEAIDNLQIPAALVPHLQPNHFLKGFLYVHLHDHRFPTLAKDRAASSATLASPLPLESPITKTELTPTISR
jgi:hypothetical protein